MPAMTMVLKVSNVAWLDQMKTGDKIRFMAENVNGAITVVHFEPAK
jgi:Cu/Ag efflux protein CusF